MDSLYRGYPVGSILIWDQSEEAVPIATRGTANDTSNSPSILLDGQQRITSLFCIMKGKPPKFFTGNFDIFKYLHFNLDLERFRFERAINRDNVLEVDVTNLFQEGLGQLYEELYSLDLSPTSFAEYSQKLTRLEDIAKRSANIDSFGNDILDQEHPVEDVVEIFSRLNTRGTKLTDVDIALARMSTHWPEVRSDLLDKVDKWNRRLSPENPFAKSPLDLKWLLRTTVAVKFGATNFNKLWKNEPDEVKVAFEDTSSSIDHTLNLISDRLGLDHLHFILSPYSLPIICRWKSMLEGHSNSTDEGQILAWYVRAAIRGRFSSATDDAIRTSISILDEDHIPGLDRELDRWVQQQGGRKKIVPEDFAGSGTRRVGRNQTFLSLLYMMTRVGSGRDLFNGNVLSSHLHGTSSKLEVHHIFPRKLLEEEKKYDSEEIDAHANLCYITAGTNKEISRANPNKYLPYALGLHKEVLDSQWIPSKPELWEVTNYRKFLKARRRLMANSMNELLDQLRSGTLTYHSDKSPRVSISLHDQMDARLQHIIDICSDMGLSQPITNHEFRRPDGASFAPDLAWPDGLQEGLSEPVAYLLEADERAARWQGIEGWRFFFTPDTFREYIEEL